MNDPDDLVPATTAATEFEAGTIVAVLKDAGIEARQVSGVEMLLGSAAAGLGDPIKILVRAGDLAKAREALERNREDSVDIDWSEVDVGAPEPPASPPDRRTVRRFWVGATVVIVVAVVVFVLLKAGALPIKW